MGFPNCGAQSQSPRTQPASTPQHCRRPPPLPCTQPPSPNCSYRLNVWDVGGQKTIRSYWRNYFEQTDGLIWVVDSADRRRLKDCREELAALLSQEKLAGATIIILANKQDLAGALSLEEIADALALRSARFERRHWQIHACSAVTGAGLVEGMDWLITDIAGRIFMGE